MTPEAIPIFAAPVVLGALLWVLRSGNKAASSQKSRIMTTLRQLEQKIAAVSAMAQSAAKNCAEKHAAVQVSREQDQAALDRADAALDTIVQTLAPLAEPPPADTTGFKADEHSPVVVQPDPIPAEG